ncbi:MAG: hypothetical protein AAF809_08480 [Bacteroidota bacterium]
MEYTHPFFPLNVGDTRVYESTFYHDGVPPRKWSETIVRRVEVRDRVYYLFQSDGRNEYMRLGPTGKVWAYVPDERRDELWLDLNSVDGYQLVEQSSPTGTGQLPSSAVVDVSVSRKTRSILGDNVASIAFYFDSKLFMDDESEIIVSEGLGVTSFYRALGPFGKLISAQIGDDLYPSFGASSSKLR